MPSVTIYGQYISPPARSVILTAKAIDLPYDLKIVDLFKGDHMKPEFIKMNPLHQIPVLDDEGTVLYESHAILPYLVDKYGKDDSLYPKDLAKRAVVNARLHFDSSVLFPKGRQTVIAILGGSDKVPEEILAPFKETLDVLEIILGDNDWVAHTPNFTIADIVILSTLENLEAMIPHMKDRPKLLAWLTRGRRAIPGFKEITEPGVAELKKYVLSKLKKN